MQIAPKPVFKFSNATSKTVVKSEPVLKMESDDEIIEGHKRKREEDEFEMV